MKLFISNLVIGSREVHVIDFVDVNTDRRTTCQLVHVEKINHGCTNKGFYITDANGQHFCMCAFAAIVTEDKKYEAIPKADIDKFLSSREEITVVVDGFHKQVKFKVTEVK